MLDRLEFLIGEAFVALRRNTWMTFAAVTTAAVAIFLLGSLAFAYRGISSYAQSLPGILDMRVFLKDGVKSPEITATANKIRGLPGVASVYWIPRDKAWALRKQQDSTIPADLENPFPHSYKVVLKNIDNADEVKRYISAMPIVAREGVVYLEDVQQLLTQILTLVRTTGVGLGGLMLLTAGVLIYNAIRLTIVARRQEIRIMHLVGATKATVVLPLLIEGLLQGAVGGLLATGLMWSGHRAFAGMLETSTNLFRLPAFSISYWLMVLVGIGAAYGFVCSLLAVRGPMELRWFQAWKWRRHDRIAAEAEAA